MLIIRIKKMCDCFNNSYIRLSKFNYKCPCSSVGRAIDL